jgi:fructose 1,6-bisphosphatase
MRTFPANITADDPVMVVRSKYVLSQFGPLSENSALLVNGYVAGVQLSQLRAASPQDSSCATNVLGRVLSQALRLSAVT